MERCSPMDHGRPQIIPENLDSRIRHKTITTDGEEETGSLTREGVTGSPASATAATTVDSTLTLKWLSVGVCEYRHFIIQKMSVEAKVEINCFAFLPKHQTKPKKHHHKNTRTHKRRPPLQTKGEVWGWGWR